MQANLSFQVPDNETYHAVSFEPLIGNKDAVHHILVFGCDFQMESYVSQNHVFASHGLNKEDMKTNIKQYSRQQRYMSKNHKFITRNRVVYRPVI